MNKNDLKKVSGNRVHSVTNSFGVKDAFVYYKHNRPKDKIYVVSDSTYRTLIRDVNKLLAEQLLNVGELKLPLDIGSIKIFMTELKPKIVNGELHYKAPINWDKTLDLWESDSQARIAKTLVKVNPGKLYTIKYKNKYCKFKNKEYYSLKPSRTLKTKLKDRVKLKEEIPYYNKYQSNGKL